MQIKQIMIAIDQLANALLGGWSDETISSRCWRIPRLFHFCKKISQILSSAQTSCESSDRFAGYEIRRRNPQGHGVR